MRILHDLTWPIEPGMLLYPGDSAPSVRRLATLGAGGAAFTASEVTLGCHVGTHVDAPAHFTKDGALVADLNSESFFGPAVVLERGAGGALPSRRHLLVKTDEDLWGALPFDFLERLIETEPLSIGCDAYCLDASGSTDCAIAVARRGLPAFVRLDLRNVPPGEYWFCALALPVAGVEGFPVRAVLLG